MSAEPRPTSIDLAHEPAFALGGLEVRPAKLEVAAGERREVLEPRIMQVLVALARQRGEVVSREDLTQSCWGGRIVSEDAINRCVFRLRKLAEQLGGFTLETVPRVGYRLSEAGPRSARGRWGRRVWIAGGLAALLVVAIVAAGWWFQHSLMVRAPPPLTTPVVEVRPLSVIGDDATLKPFAARAADSLAGFLGDSEVRVVSRSSPAARSSAPLAFGGAVSSADGQLRLRLTLEDIGSGTTLWSRDFTQPAARADALIAEAEGGAMETVNLMRATYGPSGPLLDPETTMLALRASEALIAPTSLSVPDEVHQFEEAVARRPDSGVLRATYAFALVVAGLDGPPANRSGFFRRARAEAERVIREHPSEAGGAYGAILTIEQAEAPHDWVGAEVRLDTALRKLPEDPFLNARKCSLLLSVGRANDSLYYCEHALTLRPHTAGFLLTYAQALDLIDYRSRFAEQALEEGARLYPNFQQIRYYRGGRETYAGSPDKAIALLHDPDTAPALTPEVLAAGDLLEKARKTGAVADADAAMAAIKRAEAHNPASYFRMAFAMALGRMDEAFGPDAAPVTSQNPELLVQAYTAPLRRDRRYWPLAARAGLVRYWLATNQWPDFCSDPSYPFDCRAEARRVGGPLREPVGPATTRDGPPKIRR